MNLLGRKFFHFVILEKIDNPSLLKQREVWWIRNLDTTNNGYNTLGGEPKPPKPKEVKKRKYKHEAEGFLEDTLKMIQMKNEGMFLYQIGRIFGVNESNVQRRISWYNKNISNTG